MLRPYFQCFFFKAFFDTKTIYILVFLEYHFFNPWSYSKYDIMHINHSLFFWIFAASYALIFANYAFLFCSFPNALSCIILNFDWIGYSSFKYHCNHHLDLNVSQILYYFMIVMKKNLHSIPYCYHWNNCDRHFQNTFLRFILYLYVIFFFDYFKYLNDFLLI